MDDRMKENFIRTAIFHCFLKFPGLDHPIYADYRLAKSSNRIMIEQDLDCYLQSGYYRYLL
jgi:hypothetical protein